MLVMGGKNHVSFFSNSVSPYIVVKLVLHVMIVVIVALYHVQLSTFKRLVFEREVWIPQPS